MTAPPRRVLVVALDAMEPTLVRGGIAAGWLPGLAALHERGRWVDLGYEPPLFPGSIWPTTVTGHHAHEHLLIFDRQLRAGSYRVDDVDASALRRPPFWRYASDAGLRSTVLSVYGAAPLPSFLGTQVVGWGTADPYTTKSTEPFVDPPAVRAVLDATAPRRRTGPLVVVPRTVREYRAYVEATVRSIDEQARTFVALMERDDWDLFFGSFFETHEAGHLLWGLWDETSPDHDPAAPADLKQSLRRVYEAADAALASIVERAPDDAAVFVLSPDGMAANYRTYEAFGAVLEAGGWLVRHPHPPGPAGAAQTLRRAVHRVVPLAARRQLARLAPGQAQRLQAVTRNVDVDWSRTAAFTIPHDHNSLVRVNLAGREPQGCVEPGAAYDRLCDELAERASALVDDASGRPVVERVLRVDRVIGGPVGDVLADLVVLWEPTWPGAISGPGIPAVTVPHEDARTGIHPPRGFVIGAGPGITPGGLERGERAEAPAAPAAHVDLAPTLLARLGAPIPPTLPGRVLPELAP